MSSDYRVASVVLIRVAGVPFEELERVATPETSRAAREFIVRHSDYSKAKADVETLLQSRRHNLTKEQFRAWRRTTRHDSTPANDPSVAPFSTCFACALELATAQANFTRILQGELNAARKSLLRAAGIRLPSYLVFAAKGARSAVAHIDFETLDKRTKSERARERHLLLYLQRVAAKNDTLSEFGPCSWGSVVNQSRELKLAPRPGIATRETFLERWTAHAVAAALNADAEIKPELAPRIHPKGRIERTNFIFADGGDPISLTRDLIDLLARCDGNVSANSLGADYSTLQQLAQQGVIRWEVEVPALEPHAFDVLLSDIARWQNSAVRKRWLDRLQPIASLADEFARSSGTTERARIMDEAGSRLHELGAHKTSNRFLYAATNPIGEECFRECSFSIGQELIDEVVIDGEPWIDLWRDNYAFVASRIATGLRSLFEKAGPRGGTIPLPAFLHFCDEANMSLNGAGLVGLATIAFQEVKAAFRLRMSAHAHKAEYQLSPDDCAFVRQQFQYPHFNEYTYPSADIQLAAKSVEAVAAGDYQWILAELHPPVALLHHGFYWACPDKTALGEALAQTAFGLPNMHYGFFAADFTSTTSVHFFDQPGAPCNFVAPQRGNPGWPTVSPAQTEVFIDKTSGDVGLRKIDNREYLGSFTRNWLIPLGFHPFYFSLGDHTPRLRCGKVIVQRRGWTVRQEELGTGDFTGVSRDLVVAVERLRAARDLPRYVYIRPTEQTLRRSGAEGRDKDTKPVFIDFESYLFLEIFHRWITKAGELEVTEMLPAPDDLLWREADGRRTFELRTLIVPRS